MVVALAFPFTILWASICKNTIRNDTNQEPMHTGFPIGVSYPHFYQGDPALVEAVEGSFPDKQKHESHFYIEPVSSVGLQFFLLCKT
jgi:hypothetical protein